MGWRQLPFRCPACDQRARVDAVVLHGAAIRCHRCDDLHYVVFAYSIGMVFAAQITPAEAHYMREQAFTAAKVLDYLGAKFPTPESAA